MKKNILLSLKFSPTCDNAFRMALDMAQSHHARLRILHVLDYRLRHPGVSDETIAEITRAAEQTFKTDYLPKLKDFSDYYFNCWEGDPAMEAAKLAGAMGAFCIIIGCHAKEERPSVNRLGEVALALLQWAPCPVMVVPCQS